jgi:hypothetical protein
MESFKQNSSLCSENTNINMTSILRKLISLFTGKINATQEENYSIFFHLT